MLIIIQLILRLSKQFEKNASGINIQLGLSSFFIEPTVKYLCIFCIIWNRQYSRERERDRNIQRERQRERCFVNFCDIDSDKIHGNCSERGNSWNNYFSIAKWLRSEGPHSEVQLLSCGEAGSNARTTELHVQCTLNSTFTGFTVLYSHLLNAAPCSVMRDDLLCSATNQPVHQHTNV